VLTRRTFASLTEQNRFLQELEQNVADIHFPLHHLFNSIRRPTGGEHYGRLRAGPNRLTHTAVQTNVRTEGMKKAASFHWIEAWTKLTDEKIGEPPGMTITLPEWLFEGIVIKDGVLTIHEDYFLLTGGIERWLYRVARNHAGHQEAGWSFTMRSLYEKSGASSRFSEFAIDVWKVVEQNSMPEYTATIRRNEESDEVVHFLRRALLPSNDPRYETPRHPNAASPVTFTSKAYTFNAVADN
jgi:plasmid replication initiation protein